MFSTAFKFSAAVLAVAAALGVSQSVEAQTCSTAAWTSVSGNAVAGSPTAVRRYSGRCGLSGTLPGGGYVVESTNHAAEGTSAPLQLRFFVFPAISGGNVTVFQAMDANTAGNPVAEIRYDATAQRFDFISNGQTVSTTGTAAPSRWYRVGLVYRAGQAIVPTVVGSGGTTYAFTGSATSGAAAAEAVRMGAISGTGTGTVFVDEYEASRAAVGADPFGMICRGDANGDGSINVFDTIQTINERLNGTLVAGQPDCNEDGTVNVFDTICVIGLRLAGTTCN